jgi:hypothetical protein
MASLNRDIVALIRIFTSCLTAGLLIFFISSLSGEDLIKNNSTIDDLDKIMSDITFELEDGIDQRIKQLGEIPDINPYRKFYCAELAKEIHEVSYLTPITCAILKTNPNVWFPIQKMQISKV